MNQFGIAESKTDIEAGKKYSIDYLNAASGRESLGTYTGRFMTIVWQLSAGNRELTTAYHIDVIELCDEVNSEPLSVADQGKLVRMIKGASEASITTANK